MIKAIIIDDEALARQILRAYLSSYPDIQIIAECENGFEALKAIKREKPELMFLDIQMPRINGFELLELIDEPPATIFVTAFDEYALRAFEASAVDYLLKPFSEERLLKALTKFREGKAQGAANGQLDALKQVVRETAEQERIVVKNGTEITIIPLSDIFFIEAYDDYIKLHTSKGMFLKKQTLQTLENQLEKVGFVRVHRSYIIRLAALTRIEPAAKEQFQAILTNNTRIPLSRSGNIRLKQALGI